MWVYLTIFTFFLLLYICKRNSISKSSFTVCFMLLALFVGISDMLGGYDRYIYGELFDSTADTIHRYENDFRMSTLYNIYFNEMGYVLSNVAISYITQNRYIFILILTLISYFLISRSIIKYCCNYQLATVIFLGLMFFFTFTYLRQMLAFATGWLAIQYIYKRKLWKFITLVFIAFLFHNSAIILFPLYFIPIRKYNTSIIIIIASIMLLIGLTNVIGGAYDTYGDIMDDRRGIYSVDQQGFRIEYLFEAILFLILLLPFQKHIPDTKKDIVLYNVAIYFCITLLLFVKSINGGRMGWFSAIGIISTLSFLCQRLRYVPNYKIAVIIICFFLYLRIIIVWGVLLSPYKTFFSDGHRNGDFIYELFEYDHNYDTDKFYR